MGKSPTKKRRPAQGVRNRLVKTYYPTPQRKYHTGYTPSPLKETPKGWATPLNDIASPPAGLDPISAANELVRDIEHTIKVILIGNSGVGKSSILLQFADSKFDKNITTTLGIDFKSKVLDVDETLVKLQVWDTAGQERFALQGGEGLTRAYYRGAAAVILVYDVTEPLSFKACGAWLEKARQEADPDATIFLLGNKVDLDSRVVTTEQGQAFAEEHKLGFFEVSCAISDNIDETFEEVAQKVLSSSPAIKAADNLTKSLAEQKKSKQAQLSNTRVTLSGPGGGAAAQRRRCFWS